MRILDVSFFFLLPDDFSGDLKKAFELALDYEPSPKMPIEKKPFIDSRASLFSEFKDTLKKGGRFTGCFVICQYNSETQDWDFIDLSQLSEEDK